MNLRGMVLGVGLALLPALCVARGSELSNLLSNGGFEEGLAGWTPDPQHSLVADKAAAHSGNACLTGEVTSPNKALTLRRTVAVKAGNLYLFGIWARATRRTKLVLWATPPGEKKRQMIAAWRRVPPRWTHYAVPINVERNGSLELQIIAPSSFGEPPGRIWIDDVTLLETPMPPLLEVSRGVGFNDEPTLARAADGSLVAAWVSFRDGADSLQVARLVPDGRTFKQAGTWQVVGGKGTYVLGVRAVPAAAGAAVLYAAETKGNWDVFATLCDADGPGQPLAVTSDPAVDIKPAAAWRDGALWVAWESNRGGERRIWLAGIRDGRVSKPEAVSAAGRSNYAPSIAVLASGEVCVAWHSFRENNYDVYLRRRAPSGTWRPEQRLTKAPSIDRHAVLAANGDDLWLVYENATTERYYVGRTNRRRLIVAKVTSEGLMAPRGIAKASPLGGRCEGASAAFDSSGRLWLAFLRPRLPRAGWDAFVACFAGGRWSRASRLCNGKGMDRAPGLALGHGRAFVAVQNDNLPNSWSDLDVIDKATSRIVLATVDTTSAPKAEAIELEPLAEPREPFEPGQLRIERGEDAPTPSISYQGKTLKLFFGDLHEHTDISVCNRVGDQSVDESYQHMRDLAVHDFACATDHGYNINPYLWSYLGKLARVNDDPGRFLTFLGEEWTSSFEKYSAKHPYGYYGHRNLVFADPYFPRWWNSRNGQTPAQVWEDLRKLNANFVHIPHQLADTGNVPTDWDFADETAQPVAEIFQTRGSYEYSGTPREAKRTTPKPGYFLQDAWARGVVIGVIASPDHGGGYGKAAVYAPELSREAILDALRTRHCYGTTAAKIFLDVRVDGHLMGEKVAAPAGKAVEVKIRARCPADIKSIEVCRNNKFIYTTSPKGRQAELTFVDRDPLPGRSYYYVRVIQADGEIAWSSPVWFGAR